ncbi:MAG: hypothetical protein OQK12_14935 [Motiliproteus sp.]|nr:hypothetical protein [Motiliproteus sp.]MCW9052502.1 hypothetical protein [Motiliproteus sp.]
MSAHEMGSWLITITFFATSAYLLVEGKSFKPLNIVNAFMTALLLCFGGLLFNGVVQYLFTQAGMEITNEILLGALVPLGVLVCLAIRHVWNKRLRS